MMLLSWLAWGEWRAQPVRNALSVAAIAIGVALGFAVHLVNAVALDNFTGGLNQLRGSADLQIVATDGNGFDEDLLARLRADADAWSAIAIASPVVERDTTAADDPAITLRISGIDILRAARVTPALVGLPASDGEGPRANDWFDADAIEVAPALLVALGKRIGEPLALRVDGHTVTLRIAGSLPDDEPPASSPSTSLTGTRRLFRASMDIAGAQWRLARLGRLSRIDLRLREGVDVAKARASIAAALPADAQLVSADDDRARTGDLSRAYRVNLDMLALMALFT
ncbi:MAG: ABC transporter permease, partial [Burkholderiaceae bacterium]